MLRFFLLLALAVAAPGDPLPACSGPELELIHRNGFTVCHSGVHKAPVWTVYRLGPAQLAVPTAALPRFRFRADRALAHPGAEDRDYAGSGFSRGHLVPAADLRWNEAALRDTYLLCNAIPQPASFNSGKWRSLENAVRLMARQAGELTVFSGAIYCPDSPRIGNGRVAVPCELYKVVISGDTTLAVLMPNGENPSAPWERFIVPLEVVEQRTGLVFREMKF